MKKIVATAAVAVIVAVAAVEAVAVLPHPQYNCCLILYKSIMT